MKSKFILIGSLILLTSCAANVKIEPWVTNPPRAEDAFYGVGEAKMASSTLGRQAAAGRARIDIATAISVKVAFLLRDMLEQSGINGEAIQYTQSVSKQIVEVQLEGAEIIKSQRIEKSGTITWFVLVEYPVGAAREMSVDLAKQEMRRQEALYNKFVAEQGFEKLDEELDKLSGSD